MSLKPREVDFNETWIKIQSTLKDIMELNSVKRSTWHDRYFDIYSLCVAYPHPLFNTLYNATYNFFTNHVKIIMAKILRIDDESLVSSYSRAWIKYRQGLDAVDKLYLYLNQEIKKEDLLDFKIIYKFNPDITESDLKNKKLPIEQLGLSLWYDYIIGSIKDKLIQQLLDYLNKARNYNTNEEQAILPLNAVWCCIHSFLKLDKCNKAASSLYNDLFETPYLEMSGKYFHQYASELLSKDDINIYVEKVMQIIQDEENHLKNFIHISLVPKIRKQIEIHMIENHLDVLHAAFREMIPVPDSKNLANLYSLLKTVTAGLKKPQEEFLEYIQKEGLQAIQTPLENDDPIKFVENVLNIYEKYSDIIKRTFQNDSNFKITLDKACVYIINYTPPDAVKKYHSAEYLAQYCNTLLKKSAKNSNDSDIEKKLENLIIIFQYLNDKDIFKKFYSRMLAKRLIYQQSYRIELEEMMISKLREVCGYEFVSKLHRMYTDISISEDLNSKFNNFLKNNNCSLNINFQLYVLQAGAWPLSVTENKILLPQQLEKSIQLFELFYCSTFNGRKLTWLYHTSQAEIRLNYLNKIYYATLQTYQMTILLCFENTNELSVNDLLNFLQIPLEQFEKHVAGLFEMKLLLLMENSSNDQKLTLNSLIKLNMNFSNKRSKFSVLFLQRESMRTDTKTTTAVVETDRLLYLQATIVRIMKARKNLQHNELIEEIISQKTNSFLPSIQLIKKSIETLIDKQYIERGPSDKNIYVYIA